MRLGEHLGRRTIEHVIVHRFRLELRKPLIERRTEACSILEDPLKLLTLLHEVTGDAALFDAPAEKKSGNRRSLSRGQAAAISLRKLPGGKMGKSGIQLGKEGRVAGSEAMLDEQVSVHFAWDSESTGNRPAPSQVNSGPGEGFGLVVDTHKKIGLRKLVS